MNADAFLNILQQNMKTLTMYFLQKFRVYNFNIRGNKLKMTAFLETKLNYRNIILRLTITIKNMTIL